MKYAQRRGDVSDMTSLGTGNKRDWSLSSIAASAAVDSRWYDDDDDGRGVVLKVEDISKVGLSDVIQHNVTKSQVRTCRTDEQFA